MAEIGVAVGAAVVKVIVAPLASAALDAGKEILLEKTRQKVTNMAIRKILIAILTDENKSRLTSLSQVDYAQAVANLTNANALLSDFLGPDEKSRDEKTNGELFTGEEKLLLPATSVDELVEKSEEKKIEGSEKNLKLSRIKETLLHYLAMAEQASIRAYHCSKTFNIDFQFRCARLLVETSCLYAVLQNMSSSEVTRRLNQYQVLIADIMDREYGSTMLGKVKAWIENREKLNNEIIKSEEKRRKLYEVYAALMLEMISLDKKVSRWRRLQNVISLELREKFDDNPITSMFRKNSDELYASTTRLVELVFGTKYLKIKVNTLDGNIEDLKKKLIKMTNSFSMGLLVEEQTKTTNQVFENLKIMFPF